MCVFWNPNPKLNIFSILVCTGIPKDHLQEFYYATPTQPTQPTQSVTKVLGQIK